MVSSNAYMWFGIPGSSMQWAPAPQAGFQRNWLGNNQTIALDDGRQFINASAQKHSQFVGSYFGRYDNPDGINLDVFADFASGFYGNGPIIFANPYAYTRNLFAPQWASPMLVQYGWANPSLSAPTYATAAVTNNRPATAATWTIPSAQTANVPYTSANKYNQYIAIPPNMTLYVGYSGAVTGTGAVFVQPYNASTNVLGTAVTLAPYAANVATQTTASFSGATYNAVRIFIGRTDSATASTVTIRSMMARLYPTGTSAPTSGYNHVPGQGNSGLAIVGDSIAEIYNYAGISKSLNLTLEEVI